MSEKSQGDLFDIVLRGRVDLASDPYWFPGRDRFEEALTEIDRLRGVLADISIAKLADDAS